MSGSRAKDAVADALTSKLESKIYYHRDAVVEYVEIKTMVDRVIEEKKKFLDENTEFLNTIDKVVEEKEILQQGHEVNKELVEPMEEELEMVKQELEEEKHEYVAAKEALATAKEQLAHQNKELKALKKKLQESEAMRIQLESPRPGMVTRFSHKRAVLLQGSPGNDANTDRLKKQRSYPQQQDNPIADPHANRDDDLQVLRQKLIKGFTEIDDGRYLGLKEMGKLNEKPFQDACADKLAPKHSSVKASELYTLWQELLNSPNWNPFKSVLVDGNRQEVIDVDDDKLQGLKLAWGEGPYNSVISALLERKEYNTDGAGGAFDIWNYKEGRKATLGECVDCIFNNVKKLKRFHLTYNQGPTLALAKKEGKSCDV